MSRVVIDIVHTEGHCAPWYTRETLLMTVGATLAPYLFIIVLDYALRKSINGRKEELAFCLKKRGSRRIGPELITDLDFADDITLLSEQIE